MSKQLLIQGFLYTIIGTLTPVMALLSSDRPLDKRQTITVILAGIMSGATALKAFLSTTFSQSTESILPGTEARGRMMQEMSRKDKK